MTAKKNATLQNISQQQNLNSHLIITLHALETLKCFVKPGFCSSILYFPFYS